MDHGTFDRLTLRFGQLISRRAALGLGALAFPSLVDAKKKRKRKHKRKKGATNEVIFNEFGCVNVGGFCKNGGQCCSGICQGKKDKKKCKAHDQSTCQAGQTVEECGGDANVPCTATDGTPGFCLTTTGQGAFCSAIALCTVCATDADCRALCDTITACIACPGCAESEPGNVGTGCAFVDVSGCT